MILLKQVYKRVCYDKTYKTTKPERETLAKHVRKLQGLTKQVCPAKIESF